VIKEAQVGTAAASTRARRPSRSAVAAGLRPGKPLGEYHLLGAGLGRGSTSQGGTDETWAGPPRSQPERGASPGHGVLRLVWGVSITHAPLGTRLIGATDSGRLSAARQHHEAARAGLDRRHPATAALETRCGCMGCRLNLATTARGRDCGQSRDHEIPGHSQSDHGLHHGHGLQGLRTTVAKRQPPT
jgi:hypothetical protein